MVEFEGFEQYKEIALTNLRNCALKNTLFQPVGILENGKVIGLQWKDDQEKHTIFAGLGFACRKMGCKKVLTFFDSYVRELENPEQVRTAEENWDTERPSTYPDSMRKEALIASIHNLEESTSTLIKIPYEREGHFITFGDEVQSDMSEGALQDSIQRGYQSEENNPHQ